MKASRTQVYFCIFLFLIGLSSAPQELFAQNFTGPELLARPTNNSVTVHVVLDAAREIYFQYGTSSGVYTGETGFFTTTANEPIKVVIGGLSSNTQYYYRMGYRAVGGSDWTYRDEHLFYTQRVQGSTFKFTVTSDSHVNIMLGNGTTWGQTLARVGNDHPDFHIDCGDTFAMDNVTTAQGARDAYSFQRTSTYFGGISHSVPIFLAIGNHEQEEGWHLSENLPVWGTNARKRYFPNPVPNAFYSGNTGTYSTIDGDHLHEDYYAWTWGDALFVVIDPFWYTSSKPFIGNTGGGEPGSSDGDRWHWTVGDTQYNWLKQTLENSNAKYKFLFMHQPTGGTDDYIRGGAAAGTYCEWGGYNENGTTWGFDSKRPEWSKPIHNVLIDNNVSAVFHGHDHQYGYEKRDGIVYQALPSGSFSQSFGIYTTGQGYTIQALASPGHLRVTVSPTQATVDYVQSSGVTYSYTIAAHVNNCPGDFDSDRNVDEADLAVFAANFGRTNCSDCDGDFDPPDDDVDGSDLAVMAAAFGPCD
jgi:hypothetical protein